MCVCMHACMYVCMINSIRTRSRRVISCNNTSRRAHISLLHEPINDDDDDNGHIWLVVVVVVVLVGKKENAREREEKSRLAKRKAKAAKWQWQKGKIDRYLFVSGVLISVNNYRHWQRRNSNGWRENDEIYLFPFRLAALYTSIVDNVVDAHRSSPSIVLFFLYFF